MQLTQTQISLLRLCVAEIANRVQADPAFLGGISVSLAELVELRNALGYGQTQIEVAK